MEDDHLIAAELPHALEVAVLAARRAGQFLNGKLGSAKIEYQKAPHDDLLDVDLEAERIILSTLRRDFPNYRILSEEAGEENVESTHCWIVDPLDGSANFQHGSTTFAVAIGLAVHQVTVVGVIYLPGKDEMFTAILGQGVTMNEQPINVSKIAKIEKAIIHIGEFEKNNNKVNREQIRELVAVADRSRRVRMIGTSSSDLVYVACGRADAFIMHGGNPWDVEAGKLILEEAGGKVSQRKYRDGSVLTIFTNGLIHKELSNILRIM